MKRWILLSATLAAFLTAGCGERSEPTGALPPQFPVTVQGDGDEAAVVQKEPARIVALAPGPAELVARLGVGKRLVGVPFGTPGTRGAKIVASSAGQVSVDEVGHLRPDLLIATRDTDPVDVALARQRADAPLYEQPADSVEDVRRSIFELGDAVGEPVQARRLAGRIQSRVDAVQRTIANEPTTTVFVDTGFLVPPPSSSLLSDLVRRAGGRSVGGSSTEFAPVKTGALLSLDPDVYLATADSGVTLKQLRNDPQLRKLTAVKKGRVVVLPEYVTQGGPRLPQALRAVAEALHPDAFG
ncbi:MAG TPA: ABC transporter substrate-binding protein [Gaiellaceae bacterium]